MNAIGVMKNCAMGWLLGWVVFAAGCDDSGDRPPAGDGAVDGVVVDAGGDAAVVRSVRFVEPLDEAVIGGERDLDGDLGNGVQVEVAVEASGSDDGRVVFRTGEQVGEAPLIEGRAVAVLSLPALGEGWVRITFELPDPTSETLPPNWGGTGDEDPQTFEPRLPPGVTYRSVLSSVDEMRVAHKRGSETGVCNR